MYGIKGYMFFDGEKFPFENPPFEVMTGYEAGHEFVKTTAKSIEEDLAKVMKDIAPKCTGYMFVLIPAKEVK